MISNDDPKKISDYMGAHLEMAKSGIPKLLAKIEALQAKLAEIKGEYKECAEGMLGNSLAMEKINTESERKLEERLAASEENRKMLEFNNIALFNQNEQFCAEKDALREKLMASEAAAAKMRRVLESVLSFSDGVPSHTSDEPCNEEKTCFACLLDRLRKSLSSDCGKAMLDVIAALEFYANPDTYFVIGFFPGHPCGDFIDDFSVVDDVARPGKIARATIAQIENKT